MAIVYLYDHTRLRYLTGLNAISKTFKVNLYSALPQNLTATTKSAAESGATQLATANGYTQNAKTLVLTGVQDGSDGRINAEPAVWTASGASLSAAFAMVFCDTDTNDPPVLMYDFEGTVTADDGDPLTITFTNSFVFGY